MGKLRFFYGTMNSMKSATLLMKAHQFKETGANVILLKPSLDTRDFGYIRSRAMAEEQTCVRFDKQINLAEKFKDYKNHIFFVDEVQFITAEHAEQLLEISFNNEVFCYGLKTSYNNKLFDGTVRLLAVANTIEEIKSKCSRCSSKATTHIRLEDGKMVLGSEDSIVGDIKGDIRYESVCQKCWHEAKNNLQKVDTI